MTPPMPSEDVNVCATMCLIVKSGLAMEDFKKRRENNFIEAMGLEVVLQGRMEFRLL